MGVLDRLVGLVSPAAALRRAIQLSEQGKYAESFPLLSLAAKAGIFDAEYRVARAYLEGSGVPSSRAEGARWLQRAASHGCVEAQSLLAALFLQGLVGGANADRADGKPRASQLLFGGETLADPDFDSAMTWARQAALAGSAKGQALLAYILTYGPEPIRDLDDGERWYKRSAAAGCPEGSLGYALSLARHAKDEEGWRLVGEQLNHATEAGLPTAIYLLGTLTEQGLGRARDPESAARLYRDAAEKGLRPAQLKWGLALMEGRDVEQDIVGGETFLRRAALAGDPEAAVLVGDLCLGNGELPPNYPEAARWYRRAAEAGDRAGARALGSLYLVGAGVAQDDEEAARWLRASAEAGDQASQVDLANLVFERGGRAEDAGVVADWFRQAAGAGDLTAAFNLGVCLAKGVGVEQNYGQAALWMRRAAEGLAEAQYMYGLMLADGHGMASDLTEARAWFVKASDAGFPDAQVALAEMMVKGRGGPAEIPTALNLLEKAAAQGHSGAMFALGALYSGGHGLPADRETAQRWFRAAAELGHGQAQLMLGRYLVRGAAGEPNQAEAREWLERAVAQGIADAQSDLTALAEPSAFAS